MDRLKDPATYGGFAAILYGLNDIFDINEAPVIAETITAAAPELTAGNWLGALMIAFGSVAVYLKGK